MKLCGYMKPLSPLRKSYSLDWQWNAFNGTDICSSSSARWRFQEWVEAGVFEVFWIQGLLSAALRTSKATGQRRR